MSDISTVWNATQGGWVLEGADLVNGDDLATAVVLSLFTDRQAEADDQILDGANDPRGWWGDTATQRIGSRLWLIERAKRTQQTLQLAKGYIEEALQWMVDDSIVASFVVGVEWGASNQLSASILALRQDGSSRALRFAWAWIPEPGPTGPSVVQAGAVQPRTLDGAWRLDGSEFLNGLKNNL